MNFTNTTIEKPSDELFNFTVANQTQKALQFGTTELFFQDHSIVTGDDDVINPQEELIANNRDVAIKQWGSVLVPFSLCVALCAALTS